MDYHSLLQSHKLLVGCIVLTAAQPAVRTTQGVGRVLQAQRAGWSPMPHCITPAITSQQSSDQEVD